MNLLASAIGVGLILTLILTEAFGLAAGGLVVPGYMALHLLQIRSFVVTLAISLATFAIVRGLGAYVIVYGRRRTALMIVTGYLLGAILDLTLGGGILIEARPDPAMGVTEEGLQGMQFLELSVVGYIIPGLIALWFDRQGVLSTLAGLFVTTVLVRLLLMMLLPDALLAHEAQITDGSGSWLQLFSTGT